MNNEIKILSILENIQTDVSEIKTDVAELKVRMTNVEADVSELKSDVAELKVRMTNVEADVAGLKSDVAGLKADVARLDAGLTEVRIIQENEVLPKINLLAEGHSGLVQRLDDLADLPEKVDDIQNTVSILKYAFKESQSA